MDGHCRRLLMMYVLILQVDWICGQAVFKTNVPVTKFAVSH